MKLCDSCGLQKDTVRVRITIEGERGAIADMCESCRRPLYKIMAAVAEGRRPRIGVASIPVVSLEELDKMRRRKTPARKHAPERPSEPR